MLLIKCVGELEKALVHMDPPKHQKYRRIARNAFTPKAVESYHDIFLGYAKEIIDSVAGRGECEFVTEVAAELPLMAILDLCGVPKEDRRKVFNWTNAMFFQQDADIGGSDPEAANAAAQDASANIYLYADELAKKHAQEPLTNIVGALLDGEVEDEKLMLNWHLINMDEAVFDEPLKFEITRAQRMPDLHREHRAFGIGQHFCLGSHLARLELKIIMEEMIPRLRNPTFAEPVKYVRDIFVNGIKEMKITFDPEVV